MLEQLRTLVLGLPGPVLEEVKYGGLLFSGPTPFCGLFAYQQYVSLELGQGAQLKDTYQWLEGAGKQRRHIKLRQPSDIALKQVAHYLQQARELGQAATQSRASARYSATPPLPLRSPCAPSCALLHPRPHL